MAKNFRPFLKPALRIVAAFLRGLDANRTGLDDSTADAIDAIADGERGDLNELARDADLDNAEIKD